MKLTQIVSVSGDPIALLSIMESFNRACNALSRIAFSEKIFHWLPLQRRAYHWLREQFGLSSVEATTCVRKVAYAYRNKARRNTLTVFRLRGSIPLHRHSYRHDGLARIYGKLYPFKSRNPMPKKPQQATLAYLNGKFIIHQSYEAPEPTPYEPQGFLGIDLGIINIAADSEGILYTGGHLNGLRKRHFKLRQKLQKKGTKSAKRLLQHRRRKEHRFARDVNHQISKALVQKARKALLGIAMEDLSGIREQTVVRRAQRRQHNSWAFHQLRSFVEYKAKLLGVPMVFVDPRNTSRTCPECGFISKANRVSQSLFLCQSCNFSGLADTIAAVNIGRRAAGDQPYTAALASCKSLAYKG